ncbi:hypothetical protein [Methanomethylovorans sp.]|uniref:hypothetical protein n=1 Tax=Methanomethylovorans sp. TaxID=2758717 RepID=UPI00351C75C2
MPKALTLLVCVLVVLISLPLTVGADDTGIRIVDIYSDLDSCDVTITSTTTTTDLVLRLELLYKGNILDTQEIGIGSTKPNTDIMKVVLWNTDETKDGQYSVSASILKDTEEIASTKYDFIYGSRTIPRVKVDDLSVNSQGFSIMVTPQEAVIFDLDYMLLDGDEVVYSGTEKKIGLHTTPQEISKDWNILLTNNKEYMGRVKIRLTTPFSAALAFTEPFVARDDVIITDTYEDEIGASATIEGRSQVPYEGFVRFRVSRSTGETEGEIIDEQEARSPVLLVADDETVEAIWTQRLEEGTYKLVIEVVGNDGDVLDRKERIIEAEAKPVNTNVNTSTEATNNQTPWISVPSTLVLLAAVYLGMKKKQ